MPGHAALQPDGSALEIAGDILGDFTVTTARAEVAATLAPLQPRMIWCIGLNYRRHAAESNLAVPARPVRFAKGPNTVQDPGGPFVIPRAVASEQVDYECELAVVIGRACKNVSRERALEHVLGYTCANDVSARDWQIKRGGSQWCRGKTFDTFCPLGPWLVTPDEIPDPQGLAIATILNGQRVQDWTTADMIFSVAEIITFLSGSSTLLPGTVILTGTPHGVGMAAKPPRWLAPGDQVTIAIERIGELSNPVVAEA